MSSKRKIWLGIAVALSALNLVGAGFALGAAETAHAGVHVVLAVAFGWWARRLWLGGAGGPGGGQRTIGGTDDRAQLEELQSEVDRMRQELSEAHERLDFAERLLAQGPEARRPGSQRENP
jgi:hypothetical protein